jgi:hypothetical protein
MVRFIDLGKQIGLDEHWPREFALYDTVTDKFLEFNGSQVWESWTQLDCDLVSQFGSNEQRELRERLRSLMPKWTGPKSICVSPGGFVDACGSDFQPLYNPNRSLTGIRLVDDERIVNIWFD